MNQLDEQLYMLADGQIGNKLEAAIIKVYQPIDVTSDWGGVLLSTSYLLDEAKAQFEFSKLVFKHWGIHVGQSTFHYAVRQSEITQKMCFEWLNSKVEETHQPIELQKIYVQQIGDFYFIQPIYCEQRAFWQTLYAKKLYACFLSEPLSSIRQPLESMDMLRKVMRSILSKNRVATILHKLIQKLTAENPQSFVLKQLNLFNVCNHFTSGRRHLLKLHKCIDQLERYWDTGEWAITEKERTLFSYMLLREAVVRRNRKQIIAHGLFLIGNDRLHNYAVELVLEFGEVLQPMSPQPAALIKNYEKNYLEYVFFVLIDALVIDNQFERAYSLVVHYELASCEAIYTALHERNEEKMHLIEATIQQNIALLVDGSLQYVRDSVTTWKKHYHDKKSPYSLIAWQSSKHVCNLLKILFVAEEDSVLERLLDAYNKYLRYDVHLASLRKFIEQRVIVFEENINIVL